MKINFEKDKLLILLLVADIAFIILHILHVYTPVLPDTLYSLAKPRSYSEFFQFTKELWIVILLLAAGYTLRRGLFISFSGLFFYFLLDDSFELHETAGKTLAETMAFQPAFGLRPVDFGELLVSGSFGLLFLVWITLSYLRSDPAARRVALVLVRLIGLMLFFGVIVDMVEIIIDLPAISRILVIVEDGGEMVVMSFITGFVYRLDQQGKSQEGSEDLADRSSGI